MIYRKIVKGSNTYYVSQSDSYAAVAGKLYYNGVLTTDGAYTLNIEDGSQVIITVKNGVIA